MAQAYVGEIRMFGGNFAPEGWAFCDGQLLPISENDVLFQLIGTTYGGDGEETFALPNLQSRIPLHQGQGAVSYFQIGELTGVESVTLSNQQIPSHNHHIEGPQLPYRGDGPGNSADPLNNGLGIGVGKKYYASDGPTGTMAPLSGTFELSLVGGSQPHNNMQPYLCVNFIISLYGVFPSQT